MKCSQNIINNNGAAWVSDENKIIYLGIPKNASSSMRATIRDGIGIDNIINLNNIPEDKSDYKIFTVIRNPINRFASGLVESFFRQETPDDIKDLFKMGLSDFTISNYITILESEFCELHTAPQTFFLKNLNGEPFKIDKTLIFENIEEEFKKMCSEFEVNKKLLHKNDNRKNKSERILNLIHINSNFLNRLNALYAEDVEFYEKLLIK